MAARWFTRLAVNYCDRLKAMVAQDFLDSQVRAWLDGVEPAWTLLTFESLQALRQEPSVARTAIRIANNLSREEIAGSPIARNTLILLRAASEHGGLPLTATGNLTRAVVAEMCKLIEWPDFDQADTFRFNKVINEPDFLPLHVVRQLAQAATLVLAQRGKLVAMPLQIPAERGWAREPLGTPVSSCILAYGPELLWPRAARVLAAGGCWSGPLVTVGLRR